MCVNFQDVLVDVFLVNGDVNRSRECVTIETTDHELKPCQDFEYVWVFTEILLLLCKLIKCMVVLVWFLGALLSIVDVVLMMGRNCMNGIVM